MNYELYVDVLFLENFLMDYILLLLVWRTLHCQTKHIRVACGAIVGAVLTCVIVILPLPNAVLEILLFHFIVNTCMVQVGLKIRKISQFTKALILLYIGAFFMGGFMEALYPYAKIGGFFLLFAIVGYYLALSMWQFVEKLQNWNRHHVEVIFYDQEKQIKRKALIDTGNHLKDPVTGKSVSVVDKETADHFLDEKKNSLRTIPYRTVGKKDGYMSVFQIEKLCIIGNEPYWVDHPILGIAEERFGEEFCVILSPDLI